MRKLIIILSAICISTLAYKISNPAVPKGVILTYNTLSIQIDSLIDSGTFTITYSDGDFVSSTEFYNQNTLLKISTTYTNKPYSGIIETEGYYKDGITFLIRILHFNNKGHIDLNYEIYYIDDEIIEIKNIGGKKKYIKFINNEIDRIKTSPKTSLIQ